MRRIALLLASMAAVCGLLVPGLASAGTSVGHPVHAAQAEKAGTKVFWGRICTQDNPGHCWSAWGGNDGDGQAVKYYDTSASGENMHWNVWQLGIVSNNYPFTPGTAAYNKGLPGYYAGRPTYQFALAPNGVGSGQCAANNYFGGGDVQVQFEPCDSTDPSQEWIYSGYSYFVNVYATEVAYADGLNYKMCAGTSVYGPGNGNRVMVTETLGKQMTFYNA